jgi:hypothetical protein
MSDEFGPVDLEENEFGSHDVFCNACDYHAVAFSGLATAQALAEAHAQTHES